MQASRWIIGLAGMLLFGIGDAWLPAQEARRLPPEPRPAVVQVSYEIATRGPLHEAFAKPYSSDPIPGVTIDAPPPDPIEELPPEIAPQGENVSWVPGYWGWEPDRETFIWISGIWRNAPPGQQWVPGYWAEVDGQHQWVSGFWTREDSQSLVYLPYPPESLEQGPDSAPPAGDYFWVPGNWLWVGNEYQWQPGYWSRAYQEWVWNPSEYVWTPYGCIYTAGHWDYRPTERGLVFAPVYIQPQIARTTVVRYTPTVLVHVPRTFVHWFVSPRYHHYYYGNYYGRDYEQVNLLPWYTYRSQPGYHDPLLNYYRWSYARQNVDFIERLARWHRYYAFYEDRRPPVTFAQQREVFARVGEDATAGHVQLAQSIEEAVDEADAQRQPERRFRHLQQERRQELAQTAEALREVQQLRERVERMAAQQPGERPGVADGEPRRLELPDQLRRDLQLSSDPDEQESRVADRRRPGRRDADRPRGPQVAQERPAEEEPGQEQVRAARPVTPPDDAAEEEPRPEGPAVADQQPEQQPDQQPDQQVTQQPNQQPAAQPGQPAPDERPQEAAGQPEPPAPPSRELVQRADEAAGTDRPGGRLPAALPGERRRPGQPGRTPLDQPQRELQPGQQDPGEEALQQQPTLRRGQPRGFDGRSLPVPPQVRADDQLRPDDQAAAARGERGEAPTRRFPPFGARQRPDGEPQQAREIPRGRQFRGFGPLDEQPPEIDEDAQRRRGPERADRARGAARQGALRSQPGRRPAAERPQREEDRPARPEQDEPAPQQPPEKEPDEPDDEAEDDAEEADDGAEE